MAIVVISINLLYCYIRLQHLFKSFNQIYLNSNMANDDLIVEDIINDFIVLDSNNDNDLFYLFRPRILSEISMVREKIKHPDIDSIIDHIVKTGPPVTEWKSIAFFLTDLISPTFIENKKSPNGTDSFYITTELEKNKFE